MEVFYSTLLMIFAFCLGACPFSLWIGKLLLGKDIRDYGDGNPGAINVFKAGGRKSGYLAISFELAKAIPFIVLARSLFGLPEIIIAAVALSAILGHAFSPLLRLKGGKALAVTFGTFLAIPLHDVFIVFALLMFIGFLLIENDSWIVILGATGSLIYLTITRGSSWESLFMLCVLLLLIVKHFSSLQTIPRFRGKLMHWLRARSTAHSG